MASGIFRDDGRASVATANGDDGTNVAAVIVDDDDVAIRLTPSEERLFGTLISAAEYYERGEISVTDETSDSIKTRKGWVSGPTMLSSNDAVGGGASSSYVPSSRRTKLPERVEIRVAGGWVRDKILGLESSDVDVALDSMYGVDFASIVQEYLLKLEREGVITAPKKRHRVCVISANPAQFKRLETATMKFLDGELDFVHLRPPPEDAAAVEGRIFGTPREDALLRDFTFNALFYNIRTSKVEDWTGRGVIDLLGRGPTGRRIVAAPLNDASETLLDDPLRALRAVRFAVRIDADLDDKVRSAIRNDEGVRRCLRFDGGGGGEGSEVSVGSVSRERVGKEVEGMLSGTGATPIRALKMLVELGLAPLVFPIPETSCALATDECGRTWENHREWEEASELLDILEKALEYHRGEGKERFAELGASDEQPRSLAESVDVRLIHLVAFLLPFRGLMYEYKKGRNQTVVTFMIKEGVKFKNKDEVAISTLLENVESMRSLLRSLGRRLASMRVQNESMNMETLPTTAALLPPQETGMLLRKVKELWPTCLVLASVLEMKAPEAAGIGNGGNSVGIGAILGFDRTQDVLRSTGEVFRAVLRQGLDRAWRIRPLLDGRAIVNTLGLDNPGPAVQIFIDEKIKCMLLHPDGTRDECESHLQKTKRERYASGSA